MKEANDLHMETRLLHDGMAQDPLQGAMVHPLFMTTAFGYGDPEDIEATFAGRDAGYLYTRIQNPTIADFERRVAASEGGVGAVATASGMAAISTAILTLCEQGDEVVAARTIFGGTYSLLGRTLSRYGIKTAFVDPLDIEMIRNAITDRTRVVFIETTGNPRLDVPDISAVAETAHEKGAVLVVDNTLTTPFLVRPGEWGADVVVHSASKFLSGHGTAIGGVIVDTGLFDWGAGRHPLLAQYHAKFRKFAFLAALRGQVHRDLGGCISPFNAFLIASGLDCLSVRMERHCENALAMSAFLEKHPAVESVRYPGLESHEGHVLAGRQLGGRYGAILAIRLGSRERCFRFLKGLKRIKSVPNLGDVRTLAIHPASTICRDVVGADRDAMGAWDDVVRISVGLEHIDDIKQDMEEGLEIAD